jgi:hypothetical protein
VSGNPEFRSYINETLLGLTIKLGESKTSVKELAETTLESLSKFKEVGCKTIVALLCKDKGVPKVLTDYKHTSARLNTINKLITINGVNDQNLNIGDTMDFAAFHLENTNSEVRKSSHDLIVEFMKVLGPEAVGPMLEGVRRNIID